jgi:hypothetical protein
VKHKNNHGHYPNSASNQPKSQNPLTPIHLKLTVAKAGLRRLSLSTIAILEAEYAKTTVPRQSFLACLQAHNACALRKRPRESQDSYNRAGVILAARLIARHRAEAEGGTSNMSREQAIRVSLSFGLALIVSAPALGDPPGQAPVPVIVAGSVAVDGSGRTGEQNVPEVMFGGKTPPHGFQICRFPVGGPCCSVAFSDIHNAPPEAYYQLTAPILQNTVNRGECYTTPLGYKPPGPVYILSPDNTGVPFFARMW